MEILKIFETIITLFFGASLFINALLFIPQAFRIFKHKTAHDVSLLTFIGFCLTQAAAVLYGYIQSDKILIVGYLMSLLACGAVTILIVIYQKHDS